MDAPINEYWRGVINQLDIADDSLVEMDETSLDTEMGTVYKVFTETYIFQSSVSPRQWQLKKTRRFARLGNQSFRDAAKEFDS